MKHTDLVHVLSLWRADEDKYEYEYEKEKEKKKKKNQKRGEQADSRYDTLLYILRSLQSIWMVPHYE